MAIRALLTDDDSKLAVADHGALSANDTPHDDGYALGVRSGSFLLFALPRLAGSTRCGEHIVGDADDGERCGVAGSWGENSGPGFATWLLLEPLGARHASVDGALNPRPAFPLGFASERLEKGAEIERADLLALCIRDDLDGIELAGWHATEASVTVHKKSWRKLYKKRSTESWEVSWSIDCPDAAVSSEGKDVLELFEGGGARFSEFYGPVPGVDP